MTKPQTPSVKQLPTLKNRSQFLALRQAPRFSCEDFVLQGNIGHKPACGLASQTMPSAGYTVTKKIGNSVERNRIRRRLRQALAVAMNERLDMQMRRHPNEPYCGEMVVVARRSAINQNFQDLVSKFTKGIDRLVAKGNKAV